MTEQYSITPPPELVEDWIELAKPLPQRPPNPGELAALAARWGADMELEACCEWLHAWTQDKHPGGIENLRAARRPKPPSLKEQALQALDSFEGFTGSLQEVDTIRRALEQLP